MFFNDIIETKNALLLEKSSFDNYWGIGKNRKGKNMLGKIIMQVREDLKSKRIFICTYGEIRSVTAVNLYGGIALGLRAKRTLEEKRKFRDLLLNALEVYVFEDYDFDEPKRNYNSQELWKKFPQIKIKKILYIPDHYGKVNNDHLIMRIKKEMKGNG